MAGDSEGPHVRQPRNAQEWEAFLARYSLGELYHTSFSPPGGEGISPDAPDVVDDAVEMQTARGSVGGGSGGPSTARNSVSSTGLDERSSRRTSIPLVPPSSRSRGSVQDIGPLPESSDEESPAGTRRRSRPRPPHRARAARQPPPPASGQAPTEEAIASASASTSQTPLSRVKNESASTPSTEVDTNFTPPTLSRMSSLATGASTPGAFEMTNQDPAIPNIPTDQLAGAVPNADEAMERRREKQRPDKSGDALTFANIQQLKKDQKAEQRVHDEAEAAEDMRRAGEGKAAADVAAGQPAHVASASQPASSKPSASKSLTERGNRRRRPEDREVVERNGSSDEADAAYERDSTDEDEPARRASTMTATAPAPASKPGPAQPPTRPKARPRRPRSRGSLVSRSATLVRPKDETSETTGTASSGFEMPNPPLNIAAERERVERFFQEHGYMPAPTQPRDAVRRRLRAIRRLGLDNPEQIHHETLDRFTRLAVSIFSTRMALITIVGIDRQIFLSEIGFGASWSELDISFCCHTIMSDGRNASCFVVPDPSQDWRFAKNPLVDAGMIGFYAGAPLRVGREGKKPAVIGTLCILDDKPREFSAEDGRLLQDLAECVVSELELLYTRTATEQSAKLHHISVEFLRRSLKHRPHERAGRTGSRPSHEMSGTSSTHSSNKRRSGADDNQSDEEIDIYDEACREIRHALNAYAVAIVDLSQFHLFYPTYQTSSVAGSSAMRGAGSRGASTAYGPGRSFTTATPQGPMSGSPAPGSRVSDPINLSDEAAGSSSQEHARSMQSLPSQAGTQAADEGDAYSKPADVRRARQTWALTDPTAPSRTPQVLFIPGRRRSDPHARRYNKSPDVNKDELLTLGYSCAHDGFVFNFTSSPAARKIISDFIASHVQTRQVWYTRDDSEDIAQSINHLMPGGTETSLAMPVFGFDGQVAFAVVACWTDPLFSYPSGTLQFVETIAGSLLASVMKEKLHQAERAQLSFAAAASHELRTPLHQINAAAVLLRSNLQPDLFSPVGSPIGEDVGALSLSLENATMETRNEALAQLEIIESNGQALGNILENLIDTLNLGKAGPYRGAAPNSAQADLGGAPVVEPGDSPQTVDFGEVIETMVKDAIESEGRARRVAEQTSLDNVEVIVEVLPRARGGWLTHDDPGPFKRALGKVIHNALKFTDRGYVHVTVQDVSRDVRLPAGYDNPIRVSTVSVDIKDTGRGMTSAFLEKEVLRPFSKEDPFTPGSGLGLGLAQRMIEILGGKLAISSTVGQGTLIHVELPMQLLNEDNDSDVEEAERTASGHTIHARGTARQDGILPVGFAAARDVGTRRLGKCLVRNLKLQFCRVVTDAQYASLVVVPEQRVSELEMAKIVGACRPGVEIIVLARERSHGPQDSPVATAGGTRPGRFYRRDGPNAPADELAAARDLLDRTPTLVLYRPFGPSMLRRLIQPPEAVARAPETYVSAVVGGHEAAEEHAEGKQPTPAAVEAGVHPPTADDSPPLADAPPVADDGADSEILPSPPAGSTALPPSPRTQSSHSSTSVSDSSRPSRPPSARALSTQYLPTRPPLVRDASDPFPLDHHAQPHGAHTMPPPPTAESKAVLKVLVVEDNAVNRRILTTMLKKVACHFAEAVDGVEAVAQFRTFAPDLVLLDINMPRKDGFEAAAEMRAIEREVGKAARRALAGAPGADGGDPSAPPHRATIIAVTAMSSEQQRRKGMVECGIDEWRTKPVSLKELRADVEKLQI